MFKKILLPIDGSQYSKLASDYGFWLASRLSSQLCAQHVVDPRLTDMFVDPVFTEELGLIESVHTAERVFDALGRVGEIILDVFSAEAAERNLQAVVFLDNGYVVDEICRRACEHDLVVMGHAGRGQQKILQEKMIGSVAERVAVHSTKPVLIAVQPIEKLQELIVAYDGSEASRGALAMSEILAKNAGLRLRIMTVIASSKQEAEGRALIDQAQSMLKEFWPESVFLLEVGKASDILMNYAYNNNSLLVLGAYGYRNPEDNVLGSTTTQIIRRTKSSVLVFR